MPRRRLVPAALLLLPVLAGCSGLPLAVHQRSGTAADARALALAWSTPATRPGWLPADASRIRWVAATRGGADRAPAALLARSTAALPPTCTRLQGDSGAAITASWAPQATPAQVRRCGNWAVAAVDGGYYAWTPVDHDSAG